MSGISGGGGGSSAVTQDFTAQTSVVFAHALGHYPIVQVFETPAGTVMIPLSVTHDSVNQCTVTFSAATTGTLVAI